MKEKIEKKNNQSATNTLTISEGEKFWEELQKKGYSTDRIGQGFVIHLPQPKRDEKK